MVHVASSIAAGRRRPRPAAAGRSAHGSIAEGADPDSSRIFERGRKTQERSSSSTLNAYVLTFRALPLLSSAL